MKFQAFIRKQQKSNSYIRFVYRIMTSNHDFPDISSKASIEMFCKRHELSDYVVTAFNEAWNEFKKHEYATINDRKKKKCLMQK